MAALLKSLNAGLNSWTDFDDSSSAAPPPPAPGAGVSKKRAASGKSKAAKAYLRKGPKRDSPLKSRLMSTSSAGGSADATSDRAQPARVRIEETGSAKGRQATVVRGLEALPQAEASALLKVLKTMCSVGGKLRADGSLEIQGPQAERVLLELQRRGYADVKLTGGAASRRVSPKGRPLKPAWNAPKEVRERAEAAEAAARGEKAAAAAAARRAKKSESQLGARKLSQLRKSKELAQAKIVAARAVGAGKAEVRGLEEKLVRILRMIEETEAGR